MMSFFYLCGLKNVKIKSYKDEPLGIVKVNSNGSGQFEEVTLQPVIVTEYKDKAQLLEKTIVLLLDLVILKFITTLGLIYSKMAIPIFHRK